MSSKPRIALLFVSGMVALAPLCAATEAPRPVSLGMMLTTGKGCGGQDAGVSHLCVVGLREGGAAARAGVQVGDALLRIGTAEITETQPPAMALSGLKPGDSIPVEIMRAGSPQRLTARFTEADRSTVPPTATAAVQAGDACSGGPLPPKFSRLPFTHTEGETDALQDNDIALTVTDDVLRVMVRSTATPRSAGGTLQCALERLAGTDYWGLRLQMQGWNRSFLQTSFLITDASGKQRAVSTTFRGADAPVAPIRSATLHGTISTRSLDSRHLGAARRVTVYLPPRQGTAPLHALFMADGQATDEFARVIEPLIDSGQLPPLAIIGVHAGVNSGQASQVHDVSQDARAKEYIPIVDRPSFDRHMRFFVEELLPWSEREFKVSSRPQDRALMGYSNGGSFVIAVGLLHPQLFGAVLPFSTQSAEPFDIRPAVGAKLPKFRLAAGELEPPFLQGTTASAGWLRSLGADVELNSYVSGHDELLWRQAMVEFLPAVWIKQQD